MPTLAVIHGGGSDTVEFIRTFADGGDKAQGFGVILQTVAGTGDLMIDLIQALPHFRADLFPNLARVLACRGDAADNREAVIDLAGEAGDGRLRICAVCGRFESKGGGDLAPTK